MDQSIRIKLEELEDRIKQLEAELSKLKDDSSADNWESSSSCEW